MFEVTLKSSVTLSNALPFSFRMRTSTHRGGTLELFVMPGETVDLNHIPQDFILSIEILNYNGTDWQCNRSINEEVSELMVWTFQKIGVRSEVTLDLGMHLWREDGVLKLTLYCPFWMVNKTGRSVEYDGDASTIFHAANTNEAALFSFQSRGFFGKKKAKFRLTGAKWSERFTLDAVGSAGAVTCKNADVTYKTSVDIVLASSGLTKIITFSPFYKVVNRCPYNLQYHLHGTPDGMWEMLPSGVCVGLWPEADEKAITVRVDGTTEETTLVHIDFSHTTLFKLKNKFGGIFVEVSESEGGNLISLDVEHFVINRMMAEASRLKDVFQVL